MEPPPPLFSHHDLITLLVPHQLLLLISFAIIYFAQTKKQEFSGSLPALETCGEELPSLVFNGVVPAVRVIHAMSSSSPSHQAGICWRQAVRYQRNFSMESACGVGLSYITVNGDQAANLTATPCLKPCVGPNSAERCDLGNGVFVTHSTLAACYCKQRLQEEIVGASAFQCWSEKGLASQKGAGFATCSSHAIHVVADKGFFAGASEIHDAEGDLCVSFAEDFVASQAVTIAASMAVVLINTVLQKILAAATLWERNYTVTATAVAVTQKVSACVRARIVWGLLRALTQHYFVPDLRCFVHEHQSRGAACVRETPQRHEVSAGWNYGGAQHKLVVQFCRF